MNSSELAMVMVKYSVSLESDNYRLIPVPGIGVKKTENNN